MTSDDPQPPPARPVPGRPTPRGLHRNNAAEWVMLLVLIPVATVARVWSWVAARRIGSDD